MVLSPDGARFATFEQVRDKSEDDEKAGASLWDVKRGQYRLLSEDLQRRAADTKVFAEACPSACWNSLST